mmetsp:Transcript_24616/g.49903  ORF Transcript_24616/g.49903 Transcript_24616/m.49903 type:complete len:385 (-) Transcript_24616:28-1182(-)
MPSDEMNGDPAVAFGMVIGAGMCTSVGAALAFVVPLENKRFLACSLAVSAGVMVYVSLIEIFVKALGAFSDEWCPEREVGDICPRAYGATTGLFFAGLALCAMMNVLTSRKSLARCFPNKFGEDEDDTHSMSSSRGETRPAGTTREVGKTFGEGPWEDDAVDLPEGWQVKVSKSTGRPYYEHVPSGEMTWDNPCPPLRNERSSVDVDLNASEVELASMGSATALKRRNDAETKRLNATGLLTGLAIAVHNFPEGLATFVGAMADPSLGAAIAVAISIHNVPEGVCVAMPIYYATGSRFKAFMWATLSGVSEPIGALFGYAVLGGEINLISYGVMFGLVAGMMVYIALAELLPSAYRYDHNPAVVTASLVGGMLVMALSLFAFTL